MLQYLSALPTTSACTSATSTNHVDHQQNTSVSVVSTTPLTVHPNNSTASTTVAYGTPEVRPSVLRPSVTPFFPLYSQTVMPTFSTPLYSAVDPLNITKAITNATPKSNSFHWKSIGLANLEECLRNCNREESYQSLLPTALRSADSSKIGLSSPRTREKTRVF